jgi:microcystin-dependent protein
MDEVMGTIKIFAFDFAPKNWAFCNGQTVAITQNTALFSLLGTTYGGNGVNTFALPDLRGRSMVGAGQSGGMSINWGEVSGAESTSLDINTMPIHIHPITNGAASVTTVINATTGGTVTNDSDNGTNAFASGNSTANIYSEPIQTNSSVGGITTTIGGTTSPIGNNIPVSIRNPYLAMNHCILLNGIYPSRN